MECIMSHRKIIPILIILVMCLAFAVPTEACLKINYPDPSPAIEWVQNGSGTGNERGYDLHETRGGGYILAGTSPSYGIDPAGNYGSTSILIQKLDSNHNVTWERTIGGSGRAEGRKIRETEDGGFLVVGMTTSNDGDVKDLNHGGWDVVVGKFNSTGTREWVRCYGGSSDDFGENIQLTKNSAFFIGSTFSRDGEVSSWVNYSLTKLKDATENPVEPISSITPFTGNMTDNGLLAYITDETLREIHEGQSDVWVVEIDGLGNILWQQRYGGSKDDYGFDILPQDDGGILFAGITRSNDGDTLGMNLGGDSGTSEGWLVRLQPDHKIDWQNCLGGTKNDGLLSIEPVKYDVDETGSCGEMPVPYLTKGGYILAGYTESLDGNVFPRPMKNHESYDGWLVRVNADYSIKWTRCIGGSQFDIITSTQQTNKAKYIFSGMTRSSDGDILPPTGLIDDPVNSRLVSWPVDTFRSVPDGSGPGPWVGLYYRYDDNVDWLKYLGTNETGILNSVEITRNGGYLAGGWRSSLAGNQIIGTQSRSGTNLLLVRLSSPLSKTVDGISSPVPVQPVSITTLNPTKITWTREPAQPISNPETNLTTNVPGEGSNSPSLLTQTPNAQLPSFITIAAIGFVALALALVRKREH